MGRNTATAVVPTQKTILALQRKILRWYAIHGRHDLPWRVRRTPYRVLVAEIMLQQTQVSRVLPKYEKFLGQFPSFKALAAANPATVLRLWSGLGYNRRALQLLACAKRVCQEHRGRLPEDHKTLRSLPGIGEYTARAVNVFSRNSAAPCIDTNVRRVILSELSLSKTMPVGELTVVARRLVPKEKSWLWHSALMDYGAAVSTARATGISPKVKQTPFKGSVREVRGKVLRYLLEQRAEQSMKVLRVVTGAETQVLQKVLLTLTREGFIQKRRAGYQIVAAP
ncbi:MAG: Fe-S cluster assembly protein HesB [Patescibacteria group bacterium]|jgi:A/G-specific adenine glycosylase